MQECYLRALRHFDSYRGPAMKPWLLTILRNVCNAEFARRGRHEIAGRFHRGQPRPKHCRCGRSRKPPGNRAAAPAGRRTIRRLVAALPQQFREAIVLREVNELSYNEIAKVAGVPVGTVMSRLARARSMLRAAWNAAEGIDVMNCAECEILLHALIDGELDAGHARDVEAHAAGCPACAEKLKTFRAMHDAIAQANLKEAAPANLRSRIEAALPRRSGASHRAASIFAAVAPNILRRLCRRHGAVGGGRRQRWSSPSSATMRSDHRRRGRVGAYPLAAGRTSDGRGNERPAYGQAMVQRQARCGAAGHRLDRGRIYAAWRPSRLYRRRAGGFGRLSTPQACHQSVRRAALGRRARRQGPDHPGLQCPPLVGTGSRLSGRSAISPPTNSTSSSRKSRLLCVQQDRPDWPPAGYRVKKAREPRACFGSVPRNLLARQTFKRRPWINASTTSAGPNSAPPARGKDHWRRRRRKKSVPGATAYRTPRPVDRGGDRHRHLAARARPLVAPRPAIRIDRRCLHRYPNGA